MVQVGQVYRLKSLNENHSLGYVVEVNKSARNVLVAFVSEDISPNCSRIKLNEFLYLYPAIQGNIPNHSLVNKKFLDKDQLEYSEYLTELVKQWPTLTSSEKEESFSKLNGGLTLGDSLQDFSSKFFAELIDFSELSIGYHQSMQLGVQLHEDVLSQILKQETGMPESLNLALNAALFASQSISKVLGETNSFRTSDIKRFAIRRAVELKSKRSQQLLRDRGSEYSAYFEFMKLFELPAMTIARSDFSSERKSRSASQGPFKLTIINI